MLILGEHESKLALPVSLGIGLSALCPVTHDDLVVNTFLQHSASSCVIEVLHGVAVYVDVAISLISPTGGHAIVMATTVYDIAADPP